MHEAETLALRRAALLLLAVSSIRWATQPHRSEALPEEGSVLPELIEESSRAAAGEARRSAPLAEGERIDPNRADAIELDRLPGIGPTTARRIVQLRDSGVVFKRAEDLLRVRGIGAGTLERLRATIDVSAPPPGGRPSGGRAAAATIDVNRASAAELQALPGIGPALAERIVNERRERMFASMDDLVRVKGIGPAIVERLRGLAMAGP